METLFGLLVIGAIIWWVASTSSKADGIQMAPYRSDMTDQERWNEDRRRRAEIRKLTGEDLTPRAGKDGA